MNERLEKLAEQAGIFRPKEFYQHIDALQLEKFAELIVRECAQMADFADHTSPGDYVLKHFGVKE